VREEGGEEEGRGVEGRGGKEMGEAPSSFVGGRVGLSLSMPSPSCVCTCCMHTRCCCWEGGIMVGARRCAWVWCGGLVMVVWGSLVWAVVVGGHGMSTSVTHCQVTISLANSRYIT
jgi:hypothetical protein